jgi:transposase, IS30 family
MYLRRDSAAGVRFLAAVKEGRGLKPSARAAGIGKETGYRWLRESFASLRERGVSVEAAQAELGFFSPLAREWEKQRLARPSDGRHHLAVDADVEDAFWRCFLNGAELDAARRTAGVGRSTAYRWLRSVLCAAGAGHDCPSRCPWPTGAASASENLGRRTSAGGRACRP